MAILSVFFLFWTIVRHQFCHQPKPHSSVEIIIIIMDFITKFDIEVDEEFYFAGDTVRGHVALNLIQNIKATSVKVGERRQCVPA